MLKFDDIDTAFEYVSSGNYGENEAWLSREKARVVMIFDEMITGAKPEVSKKELRTGDWIAIPHKKDLNLGNKLVFRFADEYVAEADMPRVERMFSRRGAYANWKDFLFERDLLQKWYDYYRHAEVHALKRWLNQEQVTYEDKDGTVVTPFNDEWLIRPATGEDAQAILDIYAPYIRDSAITFETEVPSLEEFRERIRHISAEYPFLIAMSGEKLAGYAYASRHAERAAYRYSVDTSVYIAPEFQRMGLGTELYGTLLNEAAYRGFYSAFAAVTLPNPGSVALHHAIGFREIGIFHNVGFKHGKWLDVLCLEMALRKYDIP